MWIKYVDEVWPQATFDPIDNLRILHSKYPDVTISLYTGKQWAVLSAKKYLESIGGNVVRLDYYDRLSPQVILDTLNRSGGKNDDVQNRDGHSSHSQNNLNNLNNLISTKANTLQSLKGILTKSRIEDIFTVSIADYEADQSLVARQVKDYFQGDKIVVRSSSKREDAFEESNAGHFISVLDVDSNNESAIKTALETVIASYVEDTGNADNNKNGENSRTRECEECWNTIDANEQVLIQRQTSNILISGVVFTRDIQRNRPYYVINYEADGKSDSVTSGIAGTSAWLSHHITKDDVPEKWKKLMAAVWEIEDILPDALLDIEFAITSEASDVSEASTAYSASTADSKSSVVIFQVRPLAAAYKFGRKYNYQAFADAKEHAVSKYKRYKEESGLTCFSDMAFWNPAEIIGDNPKNLDYSLYREIITDASWNTGLVPMGYRPVPKELMHRFGNKPYISVEESFEALIPRSVQEGLAVKLRSYYVEKLKTDLSAHDKIEFEISHNCFDFSMHKRLADLMLDGFSTSEVLELENTLKSLTRNVIKHYQETLEHDLADIKRLEGIRLDIQNITNSGITANTIATAAKTAKITVNSVINGKGNSDNREDSDFRLLAKSIRILLDAINEFGTPQFSRHARCAFIAKSLCRSLVAEGYITSEEFERFMSSIHSIAVDYDRDYHSVLEGRLSQDEFLHNYGHLRAGTYNIRSPRYDQIEALFASNSSRIAASVLDEDNEVGSVDGIDNVDRGVTSNKDINTVITSALDKALQSSDFNGITSEEILPFIKLATEQREYFKFVFTKSLSFVIELIKGIGRMAKIDINDLSYLELPEIYAVEYYTDVGRLREFWSLIIAKRRELYKTKSDLILPAVICSERDFEYIENLSSRPNFITENTITGEVVVLEDKTEKSIDGKIVVVEKADPGYDWIFSKGIAGLVTKYGGAASHMAIRCAEFKVQAAIGSGVALYNYSATSKKLTIDCKHERLIKVE